MFDIQLSHIIIIFELIILEGLLSFDNALALAALVRKKLKNPAQRKKALLLGIWGAYIFRIGILFIGVWLMKFEWVKAIAGLYLVLLAFHELFLHKSIKKEEVENHEDPTVKEVSKKLFILAIIQVELLDIMFSIDSVAVALAISNVKWVLITGALLGILLMRVAAQWFIKLIDIFPILVKTAFVLVGIAGLNIILKLKDLNLGFTMLTIDRPIPEKIFLALMVLILIGAMVLNKMFPEKFKS